MLVTPRNRTARERTPSSRADDGVTVPLSFEQERLWYLDQLHPGRAALNVPFVVRLRGELDPDALRAALQTVVQRHDILRTTFVDDMPPHGLVLPFVDVPLPVVDPLPGDDRRTPWLGRAAEAVERRFHLTRAPLVRSVLVRLGPADHVFVLVAHHAVLDRWSLSLLFQELAAAYTPGGTPARRLDSLPMQYADYAARQRADLSGDRLTHELAHWRGVLDGARPLEIPPDHPRPAVSRHRAGEAIVPLPGALAGRLDAAARRLRATPFMTMLAASSAVFTRWTGESDLCLGTPVVTRTGGEHTQLIGMFLNNLVLRVDAVGNPSFAELVARCRRTVVDAFSHRDLPFALLVQELRPPRDPARSPLFQVALNMLNVPSILPDLRGLVAEELPPPAGGAHYDLSLYVEPTPRGTELSAVYDADLFRSDTAEHLLSEIVDFLAAAVAEPDRSIGAHSLVTARGRAVLPDPAAPLDDAWHGAVPDLVAARGSETPDRVAVVGSTGELTYGLLVREMNGVAARLADAGVVRGDIVAVYAARHAELVPVLLGVLRAGAAFLVLDPGYPPGRQRALVERLKPAALVVVGGGELPSELWFEVPGVPILYPGEPHPSTPTDGYPGLTARDRAYVAVTSGSQGEPKAVGGSHGSLTRFLPWTAGKYGLGPDDRFSMLSGLSHDPLHRDIVTPLTLGARIVIPDPRRMDTPGWLTDWMARERITVAHLTPAMAAYLARASGGRAPIPDLRLAFFTGEPLRRAELAAFEALFPNARCVNSYGTTETSRAVALREVSAAEPDRWEIAPVGRGIPGVQVLVIADHGGLAGVGELGELCFRSRSLAIGYVGDGGDESRFRANPATARPDDRVYHTGDLGRYRGDGEVVLVGRRDEQVQVRGFRVEPAEIQRALEAHPGVARAVVVAVAGPGGDTRLAGYAEPAAGWHLNASTLRTHLRRLLPEYMVPAVAVLDELPITPNGKVDRRRLPVVAASARTRRTPPRTPLERLIADIWARLLNVGTVAAEDDFFEIGGHSVLGIQFLARLRDEAGVTLPLVDLFSHPTVAGLAAAALRRLTEDRDAENPEES